MQLYERGVYFPHVYNEDGYFFLAVVDSGHRIIKRHRLLDRNPNTVEREADQQTPMLIRWLNRMDPVAAQDAA